MSARGFVEGRRPGTPDAKITDHEIKAEDARGEGLPDAFGRSGPRVWHHQEN
jgi:hypothetical protein